MFLNLPFKVLILNHKKEIEYGMANVCKMEVKEMNKSVKLAQYFFLISIYKELQITAVAIRAPLSKIYKRLFIFHMYYLTTNRNFTK